MILETLKLLISAGTVETATQQAPDNVVSRRGAKALSFLRPINPKLEYHQRTGSRESAQVHNMLALRPSASAGNNRAAV